VKKEWKEGITPARHLPKNAKKGEKCPSPHLQEFECFYTPDGILRKNEAHFTVGSAIIEAPAGLIGHWIREFEKMFGTGESELQPGQMQLLVGHEASRKDAKDRILVADDIEVLAAHRKTKDGVTTLYGSRAADHIIILTTVGSYHSRVRKTLRPNTLMENFNVVWSIMIQDEAHLSRSGLQSIQQWWR
jgi:hypothetical protein